MIDFIKNKVVDAVKFLYNEDIKISDVKVVLTPKNITGDYTVIVQPLLRYSNKTLKETEIEIGNYLLDNVKEIANYESEV